MYNGNLFKEIKINNKDKKYIFGNFREDYIKEVNNKYQFKFVYNLLFTQIFIIKIINIVIIV